MGLFENIHKHQEQFAPYGDESDIYAELFWRACLYSSPTTGISAFEYSMKELDAAFARAKEHHPDATSLVLIFTGSFVEDFCEEYNSHRNYRCEDENCSFYTIFSDDCHFCPFSLKDVGLIPIRECDSGALVGFCPTEIYVDKILEWLPDYANSDYHMFLDWASEQLEGSDVEMVIPSPDDLIYSGIFKRGNGGTDIAAEMDFPVFWANLADGICEHYECQGYACDCFNSIYDIEYLLCGDESDSRPEWPSFGGVVVHW